MTREYVAVYEWAGKNFSGYIPDVPGCAATAKTLNKMRSALQGALESHLQWLMNDGEPIPEASALVTVDLADDPEFPNPVGYYVVVERLAVTLPKKKRVTRKSEARELTAA